MIMKYLLIIQYHFKYDGNIKSNECIYILSDKKEYKG